MKHISHRVQDIETGITADISPTSITISGSKTVKRLNYGSNEKLTHFFTFQASKPETVKKMADAFLRVYAEQQKLKTKDFE